MYSAAVMQEFHHAHRRGPLVGATGQGQAGAPGEGPYTAIWLRLEGDQIIEASFDTYSCPAATATASWVSRWVEGKSVEQAGVLTAGMLMQVLGGLPLAKEHTAYLAVKALQAALHELEERTGAGREEGVQR
jgi:NifU-like protein involved in Fe-S cluster formation